MAKYETKEIILKSESPMPSSNLVDGIQINRTLTTESSTSMLLKSKEDIEKELVKLMNHQNDVSSEITDIQLIISDLEEKLEKIDFSNENANEEINKLIEDKKLFFKTYDGKIGLEELEKLFIEENHTFLTKIFYKKDDYTFRIDEINKKRSLNNEINIQIKDFKKQKESLLNYYNQLKNKWTELATQQKENIEQLNKNSSDDDSDSDSIAVISEPDHDSDTQSIAVISELEENFDESLLYTDEELYLFIKYVNKENKKINDEMVQKQEEKLFLNNKIQDYEMKMEELWDDYNYWRIMSNQLSEKENDLDGYSSSDSIEVIPDKTIRSKQPNFILKSKTEDTKKKLKELIKQKNETKDKINQLNSEILNLKTASQTLLNTLIKVITFGIYDQNKKINNFNKLLEKEKQQELELKTKTQNLIAEIMPTNTETESFEQIIDENSNLIFSTNEPILQNLNQVKFTNKM